MRWFDDSAIFDSLNAGAVSQEMANIIGQRRRGTLLVLGAFQVIRFSDFLNQCSVEVTELPEVKLGFNGAGQPLIFSSRSVREPRHPGLRFEESACLQFHLRLIFVVWMVTDCLDHWIGSSPHHLLHSALLLKRSIVIDDG